MAKAKLVDQKVLGNLVYKKWELSEGRGFFITLARFTSKGVQSLSLFERDIQKLKEAGVFD